MGLLQSASRGQQRCWFRKASPFKIKEDKVPFAGFKRSVLYKNRKSSSTVEFSSSKTLVKI